MGTSAGAGLGACMTARTRTSTNSCTSGLAGAWLWAVVTVAVIGGPGCGAGGMGAARGVAERTLGCGGPDLRVDALGELVVGPRDPITVQVYDAHGCAAHSAVFCRTDGPLRCEQTPGALVAPAQAQALARALHLRRTASRARCAPETLRVVQESETLWTYHACDGSWDYHCRAGGCIGLGRR